MRTVGVMTAPRTTRTVLVVGAGSGIGLATAQRLSARGDRVVLVGRHAGRLQEVADSLPGPSLVAAADITDAEALEAAFAAAERAFGSVDGVVTTAQPMAYGTVEQVPPEVLERMSAVAVVGTAHLARAALPRFRAAGGGTLVVVSSLLAEIAVPALGAYCAAKWGQLGLVRSLQGELRGEPGLHVSLVLPGAVDTPIYHQAATYAGSAGSAPPPVVGPERVAEAVVGCLDRPRRLRHVGPVNLPTVAGFRLAPWLYDAIAPVLVRRVLLRGPASAPHAGNVFTPTPDGEGLRGGWTPTGRLRERGGRARWRRR